MTQLDAEGVTRVILDLVDEKMRESRGRSLRAEPGFDPAAPGSLSLGADGAALDSVDMLTAAGLVNELFHLHETGVEDMLLRKRRIAEWAEIVVVALDEGTSGFTFHTSGTTGEPKRITHGRASLEQEIDYLAEVLAGRGRVIATVPAHHIYGFLFTVFLPARLGAPVVAVPWDALGGIGAQVTDSDLIVANPTIWRYLSRAAGSWPPGVWGTSSTAPLPADVDRAVREGGLERLVEIYGSTETGGVGLRAAAGEPFELFPYFTRATGSGLARSRPDGTSDEVELLDHLEWADDRHFLPRGRLDRVVQVGGRNVDLSHVCDVLGAMPGVLRAEVSPLTVDGETRLEAVLHAAPAPATAPTLEAARAHATERLRPHERPGTIRFAP